MNKTDIFFSATQVPLKFRGTWAPSGGVYPNPATYENGSVLRATDNGTVDGIYYKNGTFIVKLETLWIATSSYDYNDLINRPTLGSASELEASVAGEHFITFDFNNSGDVSQALDYLDFTSYTKDFITAIDAPGALVKLGLPTDLVTQLDNKQPLDADLSAIAALSGTSGLARKTAANTWTLDTNTYLTGNQNITVSGDATGSGTTTINLTLANTGITPGSYFLTVYDSKGRATSGSNPTTLSGFGITDAAPISHVGSGGSAHALATGSAHGFFSSTDFTKLSGIATGATANQTDAFLLNRANHTGTQAQSTVTNLVTDLAAKQLTSNLVQDLTSPSTTTYISTQGLADELADIISGQNYLGEWNSNTNTPTIVSSVGVEGDYYVISVASSGVTTIDGNNVWSLGGEILFNDGTWKHKPNFQSVVSVAGKTGTVVLVKADVGLSNVDNTSDLNKPISTATQTALNLKENLSNKVGNLSSPSVNSYLHTQGLTTVLGNYALGAASSVDNEIVLFSGTGGKQLKRGSVVGNAAYATTVSTQTDTTANRLLNVTWLGLGVTDAAHSLPTYSTFGAVPLINGLTALVNANAADAPNKLTTATYRVNVTGQGSNWVQVAYARISGAVSTNEIAAWRSITSAVSWSNWRYNYDTGNVSSDVANILAAANYTAILTLLNAAPINNATMTGNFNIPTVAKGDSSTFGASTAFVKNEGFQYAEALGISSNTTLDATAMGTMYIVNGAHTITLPLISTIPNGSARRGKTISFSAGWTENETIATINAAGSDAIRDIAPFNDGVSITLLAGERIVLTCDTSTSWYVVSWISRRPLMIDIHPTSTEVNANNYLNGGSWTTPAAGLINFPSIISESGARAIITVKNGGANVGIEQWVTSRNATDKQMFFRKASTHAGLVGVDWIELKTDANSLTHVSSVIDTTANRLTITGWMGLGLTTGIPTAFAPTTLGEFANNYGSGNYRTIDTTTINSLLTSGGGIPNLTVIQKLSSNANNQAYPWYSVDGAGRAGFLSMFAAGTQLTSTEFWTDKNLVKVSDSLDTTSGRILTTGWMGLGAGSNNVADMTSTEVNRARFFRITNTAVGGTGASLTGLVSLPMDGTPNTGFVGISSNNLLVFGTKSGASGTPVWKTALSTSDLVSSATDTTLGKIVTVGYQGLGGAGISVSNLNNLTNNFFLHATSNAVTNRPAGVNWFTGMHIGNVNGYESADIVIGTAGDTGFHYRSRYSVTPDAHNPWRRIWDTGNTSANVQTILGAADYAAIRTSLSLGTASLLNVVTSPLDTTAGRLLNVGYVGLGLAGTSAPSNLDSVASINDLVQSPAGKYRIANSTAINALITSGSTLPGSATIEKLPFNSNNHTWSWYDVNSTGRVGYLVLSNTATVLTNVEYWTNRNLAKTTSPTDTTSERIWRTNDLVKTTSSSDTTAGRMLQVGDGGVNGLSVARNNSGVLNTNFDSGFTHLNNPGLVSSTTFGGFICKFSSNYTTAFMGRNNRFFGLSYENGVQLAPAEFWHTQNTSANVQTMLGSADFAAIRSNIGANNASNLTTGTLADARLPTSMAGKTFTSSVGINTTASTWFTFYSSTTATNYGIIKNATGAADIGYIGGGGGGAVSDGTGNDFGIRATNNLYLKAAANTILLGSGARSFSTAVDGAIIRSDTAFSSNIYLQDSGGNGQGSIRSTNSEIGIRDSGNNLRLFVSHSTGNVTIGAALTVGTSVTSTFIGNGASLTSLNASNLSSGTVNNARLTAATTSVAGIVQLIDSVVSNSNSLAATANSVKTVNDSLNALKAKPVQTLRNLGSVSGSTTIDLSLGSHIKLTLTGNTTLAFSNANGASEAMAITLEITNGGNFTLTLPAGTRYTGGSAPVFTANGTDLTVMSRAGTDNYRFVMSSKDSK